MAVAPPLASPSSPPGRLQRHPRVLPLGSHGFGTLAFALALACAPPLASAVTPPTPPTSPSNNHSLPVPPVTPPPLPGSPPQASPSPACHHLLPPPRGPARLFRWVAPSPHDHPADSARAPFSPYPPSPLHGAPLADGALTPSPPSPPSPFEAAPAAALLALPPPRASRPSPVPFTGRLLPPSPPSPPSPDPSACDRGGPSTLPDDGCLDSDNPLPPSSSPAPPDPSARDRVGPSTLPDRARSPSYSPCCSDVDVPPARPELSAAHKAAGAIREPMDHESYSPGKRPDFYLPPSTSSSRPSFGDPRSGSSGEYSAALRRGTSVTLLITEVTGARHPHCDRLLRSCAEAFAETHPSVDGPPASLPFYALHSSLLSVASLRGLGRQLHTRALSSVSAASLRRRAPAPCARGRLSP
ncbi:hypothetical protein AB1Y20_007689 [Prymnesium parvum]|uniref:Uncharacterized protein n=1 Tax=Prymnesium parvum TaxID=97485 RepID=A0AB34IVR9_PRYPA